MQMRAIRNGQAVDLAPEEEAVILSDWGATPEREALRRIDAIDPAVRNVTFFLMNEVRKLKGQAEWTRAEFNAWLKLRLD